MEDRYLTLKLTISKLAEGRYRSRIDRSPEGASRIDGEDSDYSISGEEISGWIGMARGLPSRKDLIGLGKALFRRVFPRPVSDTYRDCATAARKTDARLRIALSIQPAELVPVPLEYLHDGDSFLLKRGTLLVRVIDTLPARPAFFRPIRRLLVAIANPTAAPQQYAPFHADEHLRELRARVGPIEIRDEDVLMNPDEDRLRRALRDTRADALYFLGHGRFFESLEGQVVLADADGMPVYLDADGLASMVAESSARFVYLNSCATAATGRVNVFSGAAQRLMRDGRVEGVVAMQTPVAQDSGLRIASGFFEELARGSVPELALARARTVADDFQSWGIPVVYSHEGGPEDLERNRIACLLSAEIGASHFGFYLASFSMGLHRDGSLGDVAIRDGVYTYPGNPSPITVRVDPPRPGHLVYPGVTQASEDVAAAVDVLGLVSRIAGPTEARFLDSHESAQPRTDITHRFLFGSRSNQIVAAILKNYSRRFRFDYSERWPGKWTIEDLKAGPGETPLYQVDSPNNKGMREFAQLDDYGIIEKIIDEPGGRVFFVMGGLGSRATRGCGWWFSRHWEELLRTFGGQAFSLILHFPGGGLGFEYAEWVDRPGRKSAPAAPTGPAVAASAPPATAGTGEPAHPQEPGSKPSG